MNPSHEIEIDQLAVGLTKPPMRMGVPLVPLYLSMLGCLLAWMFYQAGSGNTSLMGAFAFFILWIIIYLVMLFLSFRDPYGLTIAWMNLIHFRKHATYSFWGNTDSYAP